MDPYIEITHKGVTVKTSVKQEAGTLPVWNEEFNFAISTEDEAL